MLGTEFKDFIDTDDHVIQEGVNEWLALPFVLGGLDSPEFPG
jgi:hypothetical protein